MTFAIERQTTLTDLGVKMLDKLVGTADERDRTVSVFTRLPPETHIFATPVDEIAVAAT